MNYEPGGIALPLEGGYPPGGLPWRKLAELNNLCKYVLFKFFILKGLQLNSSF
jgi:hypothetical protein